MQNKKWSLSYLESRLPFRLLSLIKFGFTGMSGLVIDFSVTWLLKDELHLNKFLANAAGFTMAVISNYIINRLWTFSERERTKVSRQFASFLMVSLVGLLLNSGFVYLFNEQLGLHFYLSKAIAIILVFFWNFSANYFFVFRTGKPE
ncbi:GtrA family protein [Pedobacter sp. SAFR-022]|uniref:GtrA family protein n=1 Tax=Pedobacter sp. SAFR-022 TaxID=3436861 RepID=UPI003F7F869A